MRGLQPGHVHKEAVHLLSLQLASLQFQAPLNLSVVACQLKEDTGGPFMPV